TTYGTAARTGIATMPKFLRPSKTSVLAAEGNSRVADAILRALRRGVTARKENSHVQHSHILPAFCESSWRCACGDGFDGQRSVCRAGHAAIGHCHEPEAQE